uniref:Exocyst subunit Exo70 family protein n=1 Tax=Cajanus cajan TaxID=3821 RepID=A0A151U0Z8_CAJCA|nr:Exocyst complex component 7 [Cajanus cajan]
MPRFIECIETLKKENGKLIDAISKHVDGYLKTNVAEIHADNNLVVDVLPLGIIKDLQETVWLMLTRGFGEDCWRAYSSCRREFLKECLWAFGLQMQDLNTEDIDKIEKVRLQELKRKEIDMMKIKSLNALVRILFPNERRLCDRVFKGASSYADIAIREVSRELTISLLRIANHLATFLECRSFAYCKDGQLHPNIRELMQKICGVCIRRESRFRQGLEKYTMIDKERKLSPPVHVARIIITELLERILEADSKNYNNHALGYVFVMNNLRYIEREANLYGLVPIFGHEWLRKNTIKFQQNLELYQKSSWNKIVDLLKMDINNESEPDVAVGLMKDKLRSFNKYFDEICNVQSTWFVFDEQLREKIIKSIENILLPTYGNFIGRFQDFFGKYAYEHIKYGMFDVADRINNLFLAGE